MIKKSIRKKSLSILLVLTLIVISTLSGCGNSAGQPETIETESDEPAELQGVYTPGTYTVTVDGHNGPFDIDVIFNSDKITDIIIGDNDESPAIGI